MSGLTSILGASPPMILLGTERRISTMTKMLTRIARKPGVNGR